MFFNIFINRLKKQKIVASLIIVSALITSFVICFSYGVYQNYNAKLELGETEGKMVYISAAYSVADQYKDRKYADVYEMETDVSSEYTSITKKGLIDTLMELSDETKNAIKTVYCEATMEDSVYQLNPYGFIFKPTSKGLVPAENHKNQFTDEQYLNGEKVVRLGSVLYTESATSNSTGTTLWVNEGARQVGEDETEITIADQRYKIIGKSVNDILGIAIYVPFTSLPDYTPLRSMNNTVEIEFTKNVTYNQLIDIRNAVQTVMPDKANVVDMNLSETADSFYYKTIIGISILVSILSAINLIVLYSFIIENDKRRIAILRLCGCTVNRIIRNSLTEIFLMTIPVFIISELIFDKALIPILSDYFPFISEGFSARIYGINLFMYILISLIIMFFSLSINIGKKNKIKEGLV